MTARPDPKALLESRAAALNAVAEGLDAQTLLESALAGPWAGRVAVVSSFGAEAVVLLHLVSRVDPGAPVLFVDTRMLFAETLDYQRAVAARLGLRDVRVIRARHLDLAGADPGGDLHKADPDACCALRKSAPLEAALQGFDGWITGRKRYQAGTRAALPLVEAEGARLKINPLARWSAADIAAHMEQHDLPRHPLVARGYRSIGCAPCTEPVAPGEDARAGRWRGRDKVECGIHFSGGRLVRGGAGGQAEGAGR